MLFSTQKVAAVSLTMLLATLGHASHAHHLDGVLLEFNSPGFILDENNGEWSTLDGLYSGGGFWRTDTGQLRLSWIDAVQPFGGLIHVQFDLIIIDDDWLGTTPNDNQETRLEIDFEDDNFLNESFGNVTAFTFLRQTFGGIDGELALPGTGSVEFVPNELSVYRVSMTFEDTSGGFGDIRLDWRATQGGQPEFLPFGIDNLIVSGIPLDQDSDGDSVPDISDNCVERSNVDQVDGDGDNYGNACDADLNNDCEVTVQDLGLFRLVFFSDDIAADFNADGVVNFVDLGIMRAAFFGTPGPSGLTDLCEFGL